MFVERPEIGLDELVEHWTVLDGEKDLVAGRFAGLAMVAGHEVAAHLTCGLLLAPALPALLSSTSLVLMGAVSPS